jgi:cytochrome b561
VVDPAEQGQAGRHEGLPRGRVPGHFFLFPIPPFLEKNKAVADLADQIHLAGQYAVYAPR